MSLTVRLLTAETFEDFADVVNPNRRDTHCWCMSFRLSAAEMRELAGTREGAMRTLANDDPAPGLVGYDADGRPIAWCSISPRTAIPRLEASAKMPRIDDVDVWSIICLVVRGGCRRAGATTELLEAAVAYAAEHGAPAVEAYPVDNRAADGTPERIDATMAYCGTWSMFDRAGFTQVGTTDAQGSKRPRIVMRRTCS